MKILIALIFTLISLPSLATESFICTSGNYELRLKISEQETLKTVLWTLKFAGEETARFEGTGIWQKESDSVDAFSAYDENTAISYKNNRTIFVDPNGEVTLLSSCVADH